jgi:hypothetical protein
VACSASQSMAKQATPKPDAARVCQLLSSRIGRSEINLLLLAGDSMVGGHIPGIDDMLGFGADPARLNGYE